MENKTRVRFERMQDSLRLGRWLYQCLHDHRIFGFPKHFNSDNPIGRSDCHLGIRWEELCKVCELSGLIVVRQARNRVWLYGRESHRLRVLDGVSHRVVASKVLDGFWQEYKTCPKGDTRLAAERLYATERTAHAVANDDATRRVPNVEPIDLFKNDQIGGCMPCSGLLFNM